MEGHVVIVGAGLSAEYGLPTLRSAFNELGRFRWDRPHVTQSCQNLLRRSGLGLWDYWNNDYPDLDLEKAFSLAWFQAATRMERGQLDYLKFLQLVEPTLWHWFREISRSSLSSFGNTNDTDETAYRKIAGRILHLNATTFTEGGPTDYDPWRTVFVNLNWDCLFELELIRKGVGVHYLATSARSREVHGPNLAPAGGEPRFSAVVLKPHGSLNWYYRRQGTACKVFFGDPNSEWLAASCSDSCYLHARDVSLMPPLPAKQRTVAIPWSRSGLSSEELERADQEVYPETWRTIYEVVKESQVLSIVGYSFPVSDLFFALHVLSALRAGPRADRQIHIVTTRKDPTKELEFRQKVFEAFQGDRRIWGQTSFTWARAQESAPWFD